MIQRLVGLLLLLGLGWWLSRLLRGGGSARGPSGAGAVAPEAMVRDRVCNTFLPRSRAIIEKRDGAEHFFCSERCRRRFLEDPTATS